MNTLMPRRIVFVKTLVHGVLPLRHYTQVLFAIIECVMVNVIDLTSVTTR